MPTLRREALGQRLRTAATSGVGIARDQADRDRVSAASAVLPDVWRNDVCGTARRGAARPVGAAADGLHRTADGLLSSEQAANGRVPRVAVGPAVLPGDGGEDAKPSDGGLAAVVRRGGGRTADARPLEHRRDGDQARKRQGVAVDVRGPVVHGFRGAADARGDGARRTPCDRAKMYWQVGRLQWCWAHLKRDFQAIVDGGDGQAKYLGHRLRRATCELFEHWADYRAGRITRAALLRRMGPVRRKVERLLLRGTCRELYEHRGWL